MNIYDKIKVFIKEVRIEVKRVNWLTRKELFSYTVLVLGFMLAMAIFFGVLDAGFSLALERLISFR
jgi:preprotein translocase subunit SecE